MDFLGSCKNTLSEWWFADVLKVIEIVADVDPSKPHEQRTRKSEESKLANNVLLVKIGLGRFGWYTIYHQLPVVTRISL